MRGIVVDRRTTGARAFLTVKLADGTVIEVNTAPHAAAEGAEVGLVAGEEGVHLFPRNG